MRDDFLNGGTKSVLMPSLIKAGKKYVYASPVFGGFQIALAAYCGRNATIFCAKRSVKHENTREVERLGAKVIEVPHGYMSVVEARAREYAAKNGAVKLVFGAKSAENIKIIADRVRNVIAEIGREPDEIWCAVGSGTLATAILSATETAIVNGVQVGMDSDITHERFRLYKYPTGFDKPSKFPAPFKSMPNYDLKAFEFCVKYKGKGNILFWNVL